MIFEPKIGTQLFLNPAKCCGVGGGTLFNTKKTRGSWRYGRREGETERNRGRERDIDRQIDREKERDDIYFDN